MVENVLCLLADTESFLIHECIMQYFKKMQEAIRECERGVSKRGEDILALKHLFHIHGLPLGKKIRCKKTLLYSYQTNIYTSNAICTDILFANR